MMSNKEGSPGSEWREFRRQMPVASKWAYFDHAAVAPLSKPAQQAIYEWCQQAIDDGEVCWGKWNKCLNRLRALAATLINADTSEIALLPNTTSGISLVAESFPWRAGDNVVTFADEFPSNLYAWMNLSSAGVETRRVAVDGPTVDLNRLAAACDRRTRIVSVSWVGYSTGYRQDVDHLVRLAHDQGALLFLDAIQGLGVFPLDTQRTPVDFLAADGHKWLLGPEGAGLFYMRQEHLDLLRPIRIGWNSVQHPLDFDHVNLDLRPEVARYEGGSYNMVGYSALRSSLDLLAGLGLSSSKSPIADRVLDICQRACERLEELGAVIYRETRRQHQSGIISFEWPGFEPNHLRRACLDAGVVVNCRGGRVRVSPHAYNNEEDVDRLITVLHELKA